MAFDDLAEDDLDDLLLEEAEAEAEAEAEESVGDKIVDSSIFSDLALDRRFLPSTVDDAVSATRMMSGDDNFIIFSTCCAAIEVI